MSGTRIKVLFPIDENVPMNKCYEATSNESMYNASTLDVLEDEAEKGHTLRDCLHSGNECLKNKVLEYIYDTIVNMFNCTFENEYCDLTLDKMVAVVKEKADRDIVKKFSTPESIRELSDQLNNLDESMNGLYRQREKAPAPKKGFFDRVRTAFRSLKGE